MNDSYVRLMKITRTIIVIAIIATECSSVLAAPTRHPKNLHAPALQSHGVTVKYINRGDNAFCLCDWEGAIYNYSMALRGALTHGSSAQHGTYVYVKGQLRLSLEMEFGGGRGTGRNGAGSASIASGDAQSYLATANREATICEQQGVSAAWTPVQGDGGASTSNIVGMINSNQHLIAMVNAMDGYARIAGPTSALVNLRGRWLKIVSGAYHETSAMLGLDNGYMQFQNAHPGLSMEGANVDWAALLGSANSGQRAKANGAVTDDVRRSVHSQIDATLNEINSMGTPPDETTARMAYNDRVKSLHAQILALYASIGETPPPNIQILCH